MSVFNVHISIGDNERSRWWDLSGNGRHCVIYVVRSWLSVAGIECFANYEPRLSIG